MRKTKILAILVIAVLTLLTLTTISNAAVEYTRSFPDNVGTIVINFTGLTLDETKAYEFALTQQGRTPETFYALDDGYEETTASITLEGSKPAVRDVLKVTDTGFVYIREKDNTTDPYVLNAYKVNLTLPYLQSIAYGIGNSYEFYGHRIVIWRNRK